MTPAKAPCGYHPGGPRPRRGSKLVKYVVDASVAVKWVVSEQHHQNALQLLRQAEEPHAPAHWLAEAANALWAKFSIAGQITQDVLRDGLIELRRLFERTRNTSYSELTRWIG